ncbi:hypothetical protein CK203_049936 [Vitis vinifera]|uniref:Retrotransposon gag domain-containing protein n=1 Tax=Vitis vinifera TaxID=29760 RepID=A0A438GRV1_VITVI|nr:hypothetical protein CK203_049936 [Vitis vinifera]
MQSIFPPAYKDRPLMVSSPTPNFVGNFRDLSEAFVGQYLCSARHKQNISTLQNIKMQDNESLREFVKRFGQAILQVEACSMDAVLQIFKRNICPSTPFFESLAKNPPTTMDDLFRRTNKYSMLEDDVRAATQQVWLPDGHLEVMGGNTKPPDRPKPACPTSSGLDPLERTHPQGIVVGDVPSTRSWPYNRDMRAFQFLVERLIKAGHLKQYLRSDNGGRDASNITTPGTLGPQLPQGHPTRTLQPHRDALILSLEIGDFDVRRILVDPGSSADLVQASVVGHMGHSLTGLENPGRILSGFNGSSTTSLGRHCTAGPSRPSHSQPIIGVPADKDPPAADPLQTIQTSEESTHLTNISSLMTQEETHSMQNILRRNHDIFVWAHSDMKGIHPSIGISQAQRLFNCRLVRQKIRRFHPDRQKSSGMRLTNCSKPDSLEKFLSGLAGNVVVVPKKEGK